MEVVDFYTKEAFSLPPLTFFFNSAEFLNLFSTENVFSFCLRDINNNILARVNFKTEDKEAYSFPNSPFGFIESHILSSEILSGFLVNVEDYLRSKGTVSFSLRCWPECYNYSMTKFNIQVLQENGYSLAFSDYNFHLNVSKTEAKAIFKRPERKRLRKCRKAGFEFVRWQNPDSKEVYRLLSTFRKQKDIPLNISEQNLHQALAVFPGRYFVFVVQDQEKVIAISVCVKVDANIFYHFVLACDIQYNAFSPSVMLYEGIYRFCQENGFRIFDYGIASIKGEKQPGLYNFKEKLGGIGSAKPFFIKRLE